MRAQQNLSPLRWLKIFGKCPEILKKFFNCTTKSIPTRLHHHLVWQLVGLWPQGTTRVEHTAQYITGAKLPAIQDLYTRQCQRKARKIAKESNHPSRRQLSLLPHGKRYPSAKSRSKSVLNLNTYFPPQFANKLIKNLTMWFFWIFFLISSVIVEVYL
jgi:hypothetical protein